MTEKTDNLNTLSHSASSAAMVFTLEEHTFDDAVSTQDDWEAAPHDWQEPQTQTKVSSHLPSTPSTALSQNTHFDTTAPIMENTANTNESPLSMTHNTQEQSNDTTKVEHNDETPVVDETPQENDINEEDEEAKINEALAAAEQALEQWSAEQNNAARDDVIESNDVEPLVKPEAEITEFTWPSSSDDDEVEEITEKRESLAERAADLPESSLAARIAGLHSPQAVAEQTEQNVNADTAPVKPTREATPEETEYGRLRYLNHVLNEHNDAFNTDLDANAQDVGILIQEDWLNAQQSLQTERSSEFLLPVQSVVLDTKTMHVPNVPEITVHVYDLPDLPIGKRVRVLSEEALMAGIRTRLQPHLANAVAGLAQRVLMKKVAGLSYELQMMLNDEVPQVVDEVLEHHLAQLLHSAKQEAVEEELRGYDVHEESGDSPEKEEA